MSNAPSFKVEGVDYTPGGIEQLRAELGLMRAQALTDNKFNEASALSHTIALLHYLKEWMINEDVTHAKIGEPQQNQE